MSRTLKLLIFPAWLILVLIDQLIKYFAIKKIPDEGFFLFHSNLLSIKFDLAFNQNIAFGIPISQIIFIPLILILIVGLIYFLIDSIIKNNSILTWSLIILLAGANSNLIDRITHSSVIDFISISIYNYNWPTFNLADALIVVGGLIIILKNLKINNYKP